MTLAGIFKLYSKFYQRCKQEVNHQMFYSPCFSLEWQKQLCIGAKRQRAIISEDHYLTITLPILHRTQSDPIPRLETGHPHFQKEGEN